MIFEPNAIIDSLIVSQSNLQKMKPASVPSRSVHSLSYRLEGKISLSWQNQTLISEAGSLTFLPKGFSYDTVMLKPNRMIVVYFTCTEDYPNLLPVVIQPGHPKTFENYFRTLAECYRPGYNRDYHCLSHLYRILAATDELLSFEPGWRIPLRIQEARNYIDRNFHLPLSVAELAKRSGISETYFRKEFKQYLGVSPVAYIQKIRIEYAKSLLLTGYYQVSDVAIRCGFDNISYFSYAFHNQTGMTPSEYMRQI